MGKDRERGGRKEEMDGMERGKSEEVEELVPVRVQNVNKRKRGRTEKVFVINNFIIKTC